MKLKIIVLAILLSICLLPVESKSAGTKGTKILSESNTLILNEPVSASIVADIILKAQQLDSDSTKPLYLFVNTPGGDIQAGLELIDSLNSLKRPVHTITLFAASMGFQIVQHLGSRFMTKHAILMSHRAAGGFSGSFGGVSPSQVDNRYKLWLSRVAEMDRQTVLRTNGKQTMESYQKAYADELWLTSSQAVEGGYADMTANVKCDESLSGTVTKTAEVKGLKFVYDVDKCPLNTGVLNVRIEVPTTRGYMNLHDFINQGGSFGPAPGFLKISDTNLSIEKIYEIKDSFMQNLVRDKSNVIKMSM